MNITEKLNELTKENNSNVGVVFDNGLSVAFGKLKKLTNIWAINEGRKYVVFHESEISNIKGKLIELK